MVIASLNPIVYTKMLREVFVQVGGVEGRRDLRKIHPEYSRFVQSLYKVLL